MIDWINTYLADNEYFKIRSSGISFFEGKKDYLSTSSVEGTEIVNIEEEISYSKRPSRANMQPTVNSVWFAKMKNTLKVLLADEYLINRTILSTGFCGIELKGIEKDFFYQFLLSYDFNVQKNHLSEGSTQEAINNSKTKNIKIRFPSDLSEQLKISHILGTLDKSITSIEQLIAKYQHIKTGLLHDLLTHGIDEQGNLRSEETHTFKDSPLGRIPVEWEVVSLKKKMIGANGYIQTGPFGSQLHSYEYLIDGAIPVIMPQDINGTSISTEKIARISVLKAKSLVRHIVRENDVIFARRGDVSRIAVISKNQVGWFCGTGCILMRLERDSILYPHWFSYFYKSYLGQNQIIANAVGLMMINLNSSVINGLLIFDVPYVEQVRIVLSMKKIENTIENFEIILQKLTSLKVGLMQDLLSGKVRLPDSIFNLTHIE